MTREEIIADERYHTCGRCRWGDLNDDFYPCNKCNHSADKRENLWQYAEEVEEYRDTANLLKKLEQEPATKNDLPHCQYTDEEIAKSFIEDVEAVKDQLPTKNDSGVDYIDRQATLDAIIKRLGIKNETYLLEAERAIYQQILAMPSVTPQERTEHWDDIPKYKDIAWRCSECEHFTTMKHNYCPNCGARMVEPQESEDT